MVDNDLVTSGKDFALAIIEFYKGDKDTLPKAEDIPDLKCLDIKQLIGKELYIGGYPAQVVDAEQEAFINSNVFHYGIYGPLQYFEDQKVEEGYGWLAHSNDCS